MNIKKEIKRVLNVQIAGIRAMSRSIGPAFNQAVRLIARSKGKVIVTGIGKSGMVAQKIASTLTSTGTPAIYLHPTDGSHGSLGVAGKNDTVLAIGKSGESEELIKILPSLKRIGAKIIAITSNENSSLAKSAKIVLTVPTMPEACPLNLAPTTSSTVSLVIGDAIAIALMRLKGFGEERFALYHPGGSLGKKLLLQVKDVMRGGKDNPVVHVNASMNRLLVEITRKWAGAASIVDSKRRLMGLVTDYDIRQAFAKGKNISTLKISAIMNKKPILLYSDEMASKALAIMEARKKPLTILPVVDRKKRSVGMVHLHDLVLKGLTT